MATSTIDPPVEDPPAPPTPKPKPEPPEPEPDETASSMTFGQRLNAAAQSLRGRGTSAEIEQLRGELSALTSERDTLRADLGAARVAMGVANAERDRANKRLAEAEAAVVDFEASVRTRSIEDCAAAGVPIGQLPIAGSEGEAAPQTKEQFEKALADKSVARLRQQHPDWSEEEAQKQSFEQKREILKAWRERGRN